MSKKAARPAAKPRSLKSAALPADHAAAPARAGRSRAVKAASRRQASPKKAPATPPATSTGQAAPTASSLATAQGPTQAQRAAQSLAFARQVARLAAADKCTDVVILDVSGLSPVTDYLVIATGTSGRQMRSAADDLIELGEQTGFAPLSASGLDSDTWVCVDFVDVLLHIFSADARQYYDLESLWGDATRVPLEG